MSILNDTVTAYEDAHDLWHFHTYSSTRTRKVKNHATCKTIVMVDTHTCQDQDCDYVETFERTVAILSLDSPSFVGERQEDNGQGTLPV